MLKTIMTVLSVTTLVLMVHACQTQHKVETQHKIEVAPMHITIDVNIKVDRALDDYFGDLDETEEEIKQEPLTDQ